MPSARILVVEDEIVVSEGIQMTLKNLGYEVSSAVTSGIKAVEKAVADKPDLILMDIALKGAMDGIEAAGKIRTLVDIPIVFLTAYADDEKLERAEVTEPFGYLTKPFDERDLKATIKMALYKARMEARLKANEEWLATTLRSIGDAVLSTDAQMRVTYMNPVAERLTAWSKEEAIGRDLREVFRIVNEQTREEIECPAASILREGRVLGLANHTTLVARDGTERPIDDCGAPVIDHKGNITGVVLVFRDVTEKRRVERSLRESEERLRHSQKMEAIGTLAGGIAHDLNNMLAAIIGYTEIALGEGSSPSPVQQDLDQVLKAAHRAKDLVRQILSFSGKGKEKERRPVPMVPVINEVMKLLRASIPSTIEIRFRATDENAVVLADATQVHQVLMNLGSNAAYAMRETGGLLELSLSRMELDADDIRLSHPDLKPGPYLLLSVADSGRGMDPEVLPRIFDPYFTTKPHGKGTGLGLAVAHGIVKSHGGSISVWSEPGAGATFKVLLPRIEGEGEIEKRTVCKHPSGRERILLVDDEKMIAEMSKRMLERLGYQVTAKYESIDALETFRTGPDQFDLIITDQTMPGMTGVQLAKELMRIRPGLPIIVCTGYSDMIDEGRAKLLGIRGFLMKPAQTAQMAEKIREALDRG